MPNGSLLAGEPPRLVAVPTHFYKVVLGEARPGSAADNLKAIGAFVMPNAPIDPEVPLTAFSVPLTALEDVAGRLVMSVHMFSARLCWYSA